MIKVLRKHDMRDRIDNIHRYLMDICNEIPKNLPDLENRLLNDVEHTYYKENYWYLLYKLLKYYKMKITLRTSQIFWV